MMNPSTPSASSWLASIVGSRSLKRSTSSAASNAADDNHHNAAGNGAHKDQFSGIIFKYGPKPSQVALKTGDFNQHIIFVGGLKEGLLATEYLHPLANALENERWSLVQFLMSSSYMGYGTSSLDQDSLELDQLIDYLTSKEKSEGFILLGHSTGCQDIVHYMGTSVSCTRAVRGVILQAPVSDREYRATLPETAAMIDLAATMISEGKALELMPRDAEQATPITAYRYHSLSAYLGDDDMFSSDLTDEQFKSRLGHLGKKPCMVIFSMADEHILEHVDKKALAARLCKAMGGAEKVEIEGGNHALSNRAKEAVDAILIFVKKEDDPWS